MADELTPLYVRLPREAADGLDRAAAAGGTSKRKLVTDAVRAHLNLERGRIDLPPQAQAPEVLTPVQAAELLQVPETTLLALAEAGELPGRRVGDEYRFSRSALIAWLAA